MGSYVIVGAGPVGRETARRLAGEGHRVVLASRSVAESAGDGIATRRVDAGDADALVDLARSADAIFMGAMAAYHRWPTDFFPLIDGTVAAAERAGARLVMLSNVYGYGEGAPDPLRSDLPLDPTTRKGTVRTIMWQRAVRSRIPAVEVRASDYVGAGVVSPFSLLVMPSLLRGLPIRWPGDADAQHAWSFTGDVARALVAAAHYAGEWDRAFHAPAFHLSARALIERVAGALGRSVPPIVPYAADELARDGFGELNEIAYLFDRELKVDSSDAEQLLGVRASGVDEAVAAFVESYR